MKSLPYHEQKDIENVKKLREIIKELPPFCVDYFRGIEPVSYTHLDVYKRQSAAMYQGL